MRLRKQSLVVIHTEKTITDDPEEAKELLALSQEKNLLLCSAPDTFLGPAFQKAKEVIESGELGEIPSFSISANRNNDILLSVFSFLREKDCGLLYDYGVYCITCLTALPGSVQSVSAICRNPYPNRINILPGANQGEAFEMPNESQAVSLIRMTSGIAGTFHINADSLIRDQAFFAIYGTKGILFLTNPNHFGGTVRLLLNDMTDKSMIKEVCFETEDENLRGIGPMDLAESLKENIRPKTDRILAYHVLEVLSAMLESSKKGGAMIPVTSRV